MASPAFAPPDVRDVTLSLFAGLKLDIAPSDVPEGISPDTEDGIYLPGDWQSRPCLSKLYPNGVSLAPTILYEKTYVQPNGDPLTLLLTSGGGLWVEDVNNAPGVVTGIFNVAPGLYAQSVSEFGREYIAFSDLLHGQGVPLQYDGTFLDRVTQDGPGATPTVVDSFQTANISETNLLRVPNSAITSATQVGNIVTIVTVGNHGLVPGQNIFVVGVGVAGYNAGLVTVLSVPSPTSYTYSIVATGLGPSSAGATYYAVLFIQTATPVTGVNIGDSVVIAGSVRSPSGAFDPNNGASGNPANWTVVEVDGPPNNLGFSVDVSAATQIPTSTNATAGGTINFGGQSSPGVHQVVCMFLTRQGAIMRPSPPIPFVSAGNSKWTATQIPTGPPNVVARILGFTGAGGDNFFIIPASVTLPNPTNPLGTPIVVQSTIVPDNTSTTFTFDVPDNTLFASVPIDQIGNDLFDQVVLGPVLGFFAFASRLACWGDYTKIENFLNMGFCGGPPGATPLGWTVVGTGGSVIRGGSWSNGQSWQIITGAPGPNYGTISQPAYLDAFGDPLLSPNTFYTLRIWGRNPSGSTQGTVCVQISSPSVGTIGIAHIPSGDFSVLGNFAQAPFQLEDHSGDFFTVATPAVIPADAVIEVYVTAAVAGLTLAVGEVEIVFSENPYRNSLSRWSYPLNPEAFAQTTGNLGASDDASPIQCFALLRASSLLETAEGVHIFEDNTGEPDTWNVNQLTRAVGAVSVRAGDPGKFGTGDAAEDWALVASKNGVYLFAGAEFWKVSQEISRGALPQSQDPRKTWDDITWASQQTIVAKNDPAKRRAYFAVPINGATTPNCLFVLDYREMDTATQIASAPPLHITIQGKMKSSDLTRKWSTWNIPANDLEILVRPGNARELFIAGGNFSNIYSLDPAKLTDDDFGAISPYYTTYFFTDHDQEQALQLGADMKLVKRIHAYVVGVGLVTITPIVNSLYNFYPQLSPRILVSDIDAGTFLKSDLEWTIAGLRGQRIAFRIGVQPLPGTTDVQIRLQKFIVGMMKDPVAQFRQSGI